MVVINLILENRKKIGRIFRDTIYSPPAGIALHEHGHPVTESAAYLAKAEILDRWLRSALTRTICKRLESCDAALAPEGKGPPMASCAEQSSGQTFWDGNGKETGIHNNYSWTQVSGAWGAKRTKTLTREKGALVNEIFPTPQGATLQ